MPRQKTFTSGVTRVGLVEDRFAADGRHADRVAVAGDAAHDAFGNPAASCIVDWAEAKRIHQCDRPSAHREDVAQDATRAGRCTLVGLNCRRMVVALDAERTRNTVTEVDDTGVLARSHENPWRFGRETLEVDTRGLVGAVLRPHHRVHRKFERVGLTAKNLVDGFGFVVGQSKGAMQRLSHIFQT